MNKAKKHWSFSVNLSPDFFCSVSYRKPGMLWPWNFLESQTTSSRMSRNNLEYVTTPEKKYSLPNKTLTEVWNNGLDIKLNKAKKQWSFSVKLSRDFFVQFRSENHGCYDLESPWRVRQHPRACRETIWSL